MDERTGPMDEWTGPMDERTGLMEKYFGLTYCARKGPLIKICHRYIRGAIIYESLAGLWVPLLEIGATNNIRYLY